MSWTEIGLGSGILPVGETKFIAGAWLHHQPGTGKLFAQVPAGVGGGSYIPPAVAQCAPGLIRNTHGACVAPRVVVRRGLRGLGLGDVPGCPAGAVAGQSSDGCWHCVNPQNPQQILGGSPAASALPQMTQADCPDSTYAPNVYPINRTNGCTSPPGTECVPVGMNKPPTLSAQAGSTATYLMWGALAAVAIGAGVVLAKSHGPTATKKVGGARRKLRRGRRR